MIGLRKLKIELEEAEFRVKARKTELDLAKGDRELWVARRAHTIAVQKLDKIRTQILIAGSLNEVSIITMGKTSMIYLTHDDDEIKFLVERDCGPIEYKVKKLFTGSQYPSK